MKNICLIFALVWTGIAQATPVTPESFSSGLNTGYSVTAASTFSENNSVDWFVFDSNGIDSISFFFDRTIAAPDLIAGLYLGDTTGFDYQAAGAQENYSFRYAADFNTNLTYISTFDDNHNDAFNGPWGDPDFNLLLAAGRYSLALSSLFDGGTYEFTTNVDAASAVAVSAVPVPAAAWLFGSALLGFFGFARRKAKA